MAAKSREVCQSSFSHKTSENDLFSETDQINANDNIYVQNSSAILNDI